MKTTDLLDENPNWKAAGLQQLRHFGGKTSFRGTLEAVKVFEDNVLVREIISKPGKGKILAVDGGGSKNCALVGDQMVELAVKNGWEGIVIYGCVRDSAELRTLSIGILALGTHPRKSGKFGNGESPDQVMFENATFTKDQMAYIDQDGIVFAASPDL